MDVIRGRCLIDEELRACELHIANGDIQEIIPIPDSPDFPIIAPGFIDLQVNGAADRLLNATPDSDTLQHITLVLQKLGTTAWLPTIVTDDLATMTALSEAVIESRPALAGLLGVHFEGPHINADKKGVHNAVHIRPPGDSELALYSDDRLGCRLLTVAPETLSERELQALVDIGAVLAIGHSNADYNTAAAAISAGIKCATHLFNAMTGLASRDPGVVGAVLGAGISYGFILDGEHVHPAMARQAYQANNNMILVTDAMPLLGSEETQFQWFGQTVSRQGKRLTDPDGRLAGACISQLDALQNALSFLELDIAEALQLVTRNPAQLLGVYPYLGAIAVGSKADLVALDESANLQQVWIAGQPISQ